jgi:hypothetical protein
MAAYFHASVLDFGWIDSEGIIHSGLLMDNVDNHCTMARKLHLGANGYSDALKAQCIRWGIHNDGETIFIEHLEGMEPSRAIARLKKYTGGTKVIAEVYALAEPLFV